MRILVTGAAGFIGSHTALRLAKEGHEVYGVDNFDSYYAPSAKKENAQLLWKQAKILVHRIDLAIDPLQGILPGTDAIIHLAAQPGNDPDTTQDSYIKNNFYATVALIEAVKTHCPNAQFIHGSTSSVYGADATVAEDTLPAPISPYAVTKLAAEAAIQSAQRRGEIHSSILRFFSVYGPRERPDKLFPKLFSALKNNSPFPLFEGSANHKRSFTYIDDIVEGIVLALTHFDKIESEVINLGSSSCSTTAQALDIAQQITGNTLQVKNLPARPGDQLATHANISKAQDLLGYQPNTSITDGLKQVWQWAQRTL